MTSMRRAMEASSIPQSLFEAVAKRDYETLVKLYGQSARDAVNSYLAMKSRWRSRVDSASAREEKLDEFLQHLSYYNRSSTSSTSNVQQMSSAFDARAAAAARRQQRGSGSGGSRDDDEQSYCSLLRELAVFLTAQEDKLLAAEAEAAAASSSNSNSKRPPNSSKKKKIEISPEAESLLRDAAASFSATRPPNSFVVHNDGRALHNVEQQQQQQATAQQPQLQQQQAAATTGPPLFDGSVANATPAGPAGAAAAVGPGGAGTILHLACALDVPLALAFLLAMGADARASHTAFRRLMIHEAACNGSIHCLTLLLELGHKYGDLDGNALPKQQPRAAGGSAPRAASVLPFMPRRMDRSQAMGPARLFAQHPELFVRGFHHSTGSSYNNNTYRTSSNSSSGSAFGHPLSQHQKEQQQVPKVDFLSMLRLFRQVTRSVRSGHISELDAARAILDQATLTPHSQTALAQSCGYGGGGGPEQQHQQQIFVQRSFARSNSGTSAAAAGGTSDGHGNTPLHWAAFKNETECVSLLLRFHADPNARAHPSGWTPLHDAAYSNSSECIELLVDAGAQVDARANSGATPLCFAAQEDAAAAAQLLLERGADLATRCCAGGSNNNNNTTRGSSSRLNNRRGGDGQPTGVAAAAAAAAANHPATGPHSRFSGYTPLHYCAHYNAHKAARVLLRHETAKRAMEIPDLNDRLAIHVAVARGSSDVLRELLHAGARVETRLRPEDSNTSAAAASAAQQQQQQQRQRQRQQQRHALMQQQQLQPVTPRRFRRAPPSPETSPRSPRNGGGARTPPARRRLSVSSSSSSSSTSSTPVSSPVLRSMIPSQPITSSKPWNCLTQRSIDECRELISQAESNWTKDRHRLFTPADRKAVTELLRVGKRLELQGSGIFIDLWPEVLSFCGRGWFEVEDDDNDDQDDGNDDLNDAKNSSNINSAMDTTTEEDSSQGGDDDGVEYMDSQSVPGDDRLSLPRF